MFKMDPLGNTLLMGGGNRWSQLVGEPIADGGGAYFAELLALDPVLGSLYLPMPS